MRVGGGHQGRRRPESGVRSLEGRVGEARASVGGRRLGPCIQRADPCPKEWRVASVQARRLAASDRIYVPDVACRHEDRTLKDGQCRILLCPIFRRDSGTSEACWAAGRPYNLETWK